MPATLPVELPELPDLAQHHIAGRATAPAVELLELLARTVAEADGGSGLLPLPLAMNEVVFPKFLPADEIERCTFEVALERHGLGTRASLVSRIALAGGMRRSRVHAAAVFAGFPGQPPAPPKLECDFEVSAERIYRELIPFGPRYRNLRDSVRLGAGGGLGIVRSPAPPRSPTPLLGCPFLLDAAMHLASVWGQRHAGYVAYPTGFATRVLYQPVPAGERRCLVAPTRVESRRLICDLWLLDEHGAVCDVITGLAMSPLGAGAPPPAWITLGSGRP